MSDTEKEQWPNKLQERQKLSLQRGEVFVIGSTYYAVVGFDGRNEAYLCWPGTAEGTSFHFDESQYVGVDRLKAHGSQKERRGRVWVPALPALDHTGRIRVIHEDKAEFDTASEAAQGDRTPRAAGDSVSAPSTFRRASTGEPLPSRRPVPPIALHARPGIESSPLLSTSNAASRGSPLVVPNSARRQVPLPEGPVRTCVVCSVLRSLKNVVFSSFRGFGQAFQRSAPPPPVEEPVRFPSSSSSSAGPLKAEEKAQDVSGSNSPGSPGRYEFSRHASSAVNLKKRRSLESEDLERKRQEQLGRECEDIHITIPIVIPPGAKEVQPLIDGNAVIFDERGLKETMTVRLSKWEAFVDRQKAKLEKEIADFREAQARGEVGIRTSPRLLRPESAQGSGKMHEMSEDDISELEQLVGRMGDWKDLSRYSGRSVSMASTRQGNEMKIHVVAFAEREDGTGVDFMRLAYKKSVEIRETMQPEEVKSLAYSMGRSLGQSLLSVIPFLRHRGGVTEQMKQRWVELLHRPDVAKFTIALAFRNALENDGIHLQFCEAMGLGNE